ncbi:TatD family deoxyribonuclease [Candidatus Saccharibacteria bacterium]|nr:TatD family deoxyribonuclease [Candidatus Saccharibacteria bacterium]NCU40446.1 TatD family deoxyribonuclease [Candidatus Saccharibacteria bacterium]
MQQLFLTDSHCHIHDPEFFPDGAEDIYLRSLDEGVYRMICVGTDVRSSQLAVEFAEAHDNVWAIVGIHPHDASVGLEAVEQLRPLLSSPKVVGIGEVGLDYHYNHSSKRDQAIILHAQLTLAVEASLPVCFHIRSGFDDFWPIFNQYKLRGGVLHSFTDSLSNMEQGLSDGLMVGINGIVTFANDIASIVQHAPLNRILLETDAPYLTPSPNRGKINESRYIRQIAEFVAQQRDISLKEVSKVTEANCDQLYFSKK